MLVTRIPRLGLVLRSSRKSIHQLFMRAAPKREREREAPRAARSGRVVSRRSARPSERRHVAVGDDMEPPRRGRFVYICRRAIQVALVRSLPHHFCARKSPRATCGRVALKRSHALSTGAVPEVIESARRRSICARLDRQNAVGSRQSADSSPDVIVSERSLSASRRFGDKWRFRDSSDSKFKQFRGHHRSGLGYRRFLAGPNK